MEMNKKPWPISTLCGLKDRIDTNPDYQRPPAWSKAQKQLLLDTILRGYDIPKFYWRKISSSPDKYEVVDGQQRIRAIWEFQNNEYKLPKNADPINGEEVKGLYYRDLPEDPRIAFDNYTLDIIVISNSDEEEVREMFLRLQNGTTLTAQEKRNAMPGKMRDFIKNLAEHKFFENCGFSNKRYTFDLVAAQMTLLELEGSLTNIKNADLNKMYTENKEFDDNSKEAKKVKKVLDYLLKVFPEKTPELRRGNIVISLYAIASQLLNGYIISERFEDIRNWFIDFEAYRREQKDLAAEEQDTETMTYQEKISHSTDAKESIEWRHEFLLRKLFEAISDIELKDDMRSFTHEQRLAIYRKDKGMCQLKIKCNGEKCNWDNWEADHIIPHSKGGKTVVSNGQVACPACNSSKGNRV